mgnify:CR=1 FL=1
MQDVNSPLDDEKKAEQEADKKAQESHEWAENFRKARESKLQGNITRKKRKCDQY